MMKILKQRDMKKRQFRRLKISYLPLVKSKKFLTVNVKKEVNDNGHFEIFGIKKLTIIGGKSYIKKTAVFVNFYWL